MITNIRATNDSDLDEVMGIYEIARKFMQLTGNASQWVAGYPSRNFIIEEIEANHSFVCENEKGEIVGTFCFIIGEDSTYSKIYEGEWLNNELYGTLHRIAASGKEKGVARSCIEWCFNRISNIRVDTHSDNKIMQHVIMQAGFTYCGIIYLHDGSKRLAYQKVLV